MRGWALWQEGSLLERVDAAGGWEYVMGKVEELGWTQLDMRPPPHS